MKDRPIDNYDKKAKAELKDLLTVISKLLDSGDPKKIQLANKFIIKYRDSI